MSIVVGPLLWLLGQLLAPFVAMAVYVLIFSILAVLIVVAFIAYIYIRLSHSQVHTTLKIPTSCNLQCQAYQLRAARQFSSLRLHRHRERFQRQK